MVVSGLCEIALSKVRIHIAQRVFPLSVFLLVFQVRNPAFIWNMTTLIPLGQSFVTAPNLHLWSWVCIVQSLTRDKLWYKEVMELLWNGFFCLLSGGVRECWSVLCSWEKWFGFNFSPANKVLSLLSMKQKANHYRANCRLSLKLISCTKPKTMQDSVLAFLNLFGMLMVS